MRTSGTQAAAIIYALADMAEMATKGGGDARIVRQARDMAQTMEGRPRDRDDLCKRRLARARRHKTLGIAG